MRADNLEVRQFLASQSTMALATVNAQGQPEAAAVFFAADDDLNLYWLSTPGTRHGANLAVRPRAAVTVYPAVWEWTEIRGVQAEGEVEKLTSTDARQAALRLYRARFALPAQFDALVDSAAVYVLRPRWVRWLDNARGFGHKEELVTEG